MPRADWGIALLLAAATALSRIPFRARLLPTWDAIQFALALHEYDVVRHQPHPPGYILYVALARAVEAVLGDATRTLTWLAIGASTVTVLLVYWLAWRLYDRPTALVAAAALAASPLFWFYGEVGLSYAAEAALVTAVASLVWPMREGNPRLVVWSALALGLAGGVRQSMLLLLVPLWLGTAWAGLRRWRPLLVGMTVTTLVTTAWLVPMVWLTGGPIRYVGAGLELFDSTVRATTIIGPPGSWHGNLVGLGEALLLGLGLFLPILTGLVAVHMGRVRRWGPRAWFFATWIVPALSVYTWVHFGQYGYLLTVLPALYILTAQGLVRAAQCLAVAWRAPRLRWALPAGTLACVVAVHAGFFVAAPPLTVPSPTDRPADVERWQASSWTHYRYGLWATTAGGLREQEQVITTYVEAIRRGFDPSSTVLVTELGNPRSYPWFRHVGYYLPEFTVYHLRLGRFSPGYLSSRQAWTMATLGDSQILLPSSTRRLVWVVDYWNPTLPRPLGLAERALPSGRFLYVLDVGRRPVAHAGYRLTPLPAVARVR